MARRSPRARSVPVARAPRPPLGRALPLGSGVALLGGLAVYALLLRTATPLEIVSVLAVGAAVVATVVALTRPVAATRRAPSPLPVRAEPVPGAASVDSAFVCTKCDSYAAPPDWEALLREFEPSRDLEGHGEEKPHLTPGAAAADPVWPRWPIPSTPGPVAAAPPPPTGADDDVAGRWTPMGWPLERVASLLDSESAVDADAPDRWSISGGRRAPPVAPSDGTDLALPATIGPFDLAAPAPAGVASPLLVADFPSLEQWISSESAGLVAGASRSDLAGPDLPTEPSSPHASHCAYCRTEVEDLAAASRCTDCRRPVCTPCEDSLLEHRGERFCSPCAVNRLGSDLLRTIEEPVSLGGTGAYARSGARRARPRRRSAAKPSAGRRRGAGTPTPVVAAPVGPEPLPHPLEAALVPPTPLEPSPAAVPTKGIPDPVL